MQLNQRIKAFTKLGGLLYQFVNGKREDAIFDDELLNNLNSKVLLAERKNSWFTEDNILFAIEGWAEQLTEDKIHSWLSPYTIDNHCNKTVAIIMAGNIPLVGFHDFLTVLITGHTVMVKQSSNDDVLLEGIIHILTSIEPAFKDYIKVTSGKLENFDAVIATGSNNTSRYFEYYFREHPHIIRKNRNSVSILTGNETDEELERLSNDIMRYYGLGCRNVSKIFIPKNYNFDALFNALFSWKAIIHENRYANNYDYNKAVYLMSEFKLLENGFVILKEDENYASPISVIYYEYYDNLASLKNRIMEDKDQLQCIVSSNFVEGEVPFGQTQKPQLWDYADNVDTVEFLLSICE